MQSLLSAPALGGKIKLLAATEMAVLLMCMQSFEQLNPRAVAVVVDPIQSVKGKVVIDAFR